MMKFVSETIVNASTGTTAEIFMPAGDLDFDDTYPFAACDVDGEERNLSTNVLGMMVRFRNEAARRRELFHDCAVFALACTLDDPLTDRSFSPGSEPISVDEFAFSAPYNGTDFLQEPEINPGEVAFTVDASPMDPDFAVSRHEFHFMVKATPRYNLKDSLFLSKFGPIGPVALHPFPATFEFYPAESAGHAKGMRLAS